MKPRSVYCKVALNGKLCDNPSCNICTRAKSLFKVKDLLKSEDFFGSSPNVFVGHHGYPNLNVGILSPPEPKEDAWLLDAQKHWAKTNTQIPQIIDYRTQLLNSRFKVQVKQSNRFLELSKEIGMASKPVDVEINLKKKPTFRIQTDSITKPMGPTASLKKATITENPKIDQKVDKVVDDIDLKAADAINYLYKNNMDEQFLTRLLTIGNLGVKASRKLVPTRWGITATDTTIANNLLLEVKKYGEMDYCVFQGNYLGNYFIILTFPEIFSYELFEILAHPSNGTPHYTTDYEPYEGRKKYAEHTAGGFYATRLAIVEQLKERKRQASVLALRFITDEYEVPLGVFVVREATRKAMNNPPLKFATKELMVTYATLIARKRFNIKLDYLLERSTLLNSIKQQTKLKQFI
ncbi:MAG: hypothetical protein O2779_01570 [Nanoarchaeota archaeon]|nr:hypothetical protein [Nanoarchaeota archaeon]